MHGLGFAYFLLIGLTILYSGCILSLIYGLYQLRPGKNQMIPPVSVVIAARNEAANIEDCLSALEHQTYPAEKFEIIVVDDRSTDATAAIVHQQATTHNNLTLVPVTECPAGIAPKKNALSRGIQQATGEIILTTDADCRPVPTWIHSMVRYFESDVGLVAGFSPLEKQSGKKRLKDRLYALESLSLASVAAGGIGLGRPLTCSGRNLAYRKPVFEQVGGFGKFARLISGDDDLLLHQVAHNTQWKIVYAIDADALVYSRPAANLTAFIHQRTRHASKGKHYQAILIVILSAVYLYNLLLLGGLFYLPFVSVNGLILLGGSLLMKSLLEFWLVMKTARFFNKMYLLKIFPLAELLHLFYVVIFGLLGTFKTFSWKGQKFEATA